jgi:gliding motility-associated-like protein
MKNLALIFSIVISGFGFSQDPIPFDGSLTTINTCDGFIIDSGGQGGPGYGTDEDWTVTICPDTIGSGNNDDMISITFNTFNLDGFDDNPAPPPGNVNVDQMYVYDGPTTAGNFLGNYSGNSLQGFVIQGQDPSGCITLRFVANSQNNAGNWGFTASASCATPCAMLQSGGFIVNGATPDSIAVCVGDVVTFQEQGSTAQAPFSIVDYEWDFYDGTIATGAQGGTVQHSFDAPGHYKVNLQVTDDNNFFTCTNSNLIELSVFVATPPTFYEFPSDTTLCLGEEIQLLSQPVLFDSTWSGFPSSTTSNTGCLEDQLGVAQAQPISVSGYPAGSTITSAADIASICIDMEHSYMGDLVLQVQCPTGQTVTLHQQGGGGTQIGEPNPADNVMCDTDPTDGTDDPQNTGVGYTYCFTPTANDTWVEWVDDNGFGQTVPAGNYEPVESLDGLIGCDIQGEWNIIVIDNWGADDGYVFGWAIDFTTVSPEIVVFTPDIGDNADSSYWEITDPFVTNLSADGNTVTVVPTTPGVYEYTYSAIDNFGCENDSIVRITLSDPILADAGLDTLICDGQSVVIGPPTAQCGNDGGNYTYCYGNNDNTTFTYCPDTPGDGLTFMEIAFNAGSTETFFDELSVYDGDDATAPLIGVFEGDLSGLVFTATNPTGCITMVIDSDGSVSCNSGSQDEWDYDVSCGGGPNLVYNWSPDDGSLDDVNSPNPEILNPTVAATYTLDVFPVGHPDCVTTDDVEVTIAPGVNAGVDSTIIICKEALELDLITYVGGNPDLNGGWYNPNGDSIAMPNLPDTMSTGIYTYIVTNGACFDTTEIDVTIQQLELSGTIDHSDCNALNGEITLNPIGAVGPTTYSNDLGVNYIVNNVFTEGMQGGALIGLGSSNTYNFMAMDSVGCIASIDSIVIDDSFPIIDAATITITNSDCGADNGQVTVVTTNGGSPNYEYSINGIDFFNLPLTDIAPGDYTLTVRDAFGCTDDELMTIEEINKPEMDLNSVVLTDADCGVDNGEITTVTVVGGTAPFEYRVENVTVFQNLPITDLAASTPNTYKFIVQDAFLCGDTITVSIDEINLPQITNVTKTDVTCNNLGDGTILIEGDNLLSYSVNGVIQNGNGLFENLAPGFYNVAAFSGVDGNLCSDIYATQIQIKEPQPLSIIDISNDITVCKNDEVQLSATGAGGNGNYTYTWLVDNQPTYVGQTIFFNPEESTELCLLLTEDCPSPSPALQCVDVIVSPTIYPSMETDVVDGCYPLEVEFTNTSTGGAVASTSWELQNEYQQTVPALDDITYTYNNPGVFNVLMTVVSNEGCVYDTAYSQYITVHDHPEVNFIYNPHPMDVYNTEAQFLDYSEGNDSISLWAWEFGEGIIPAVSGDQNPTAIYPQGVAGVYPVQLTVWNEHGCVDSLLSQVEVINDVTIFAPNTFTPDGDEYNETWRVYINGIDIYDYHCIIYNRWGETVYESYNPESAWDGSYGNVGDVQEGTYVWTVYANDSYNDKKYEFSGTVNVLK